MKVVVHRRREIISAEELRKELDSGLAEQIDIADVSKNERGSLQIGGGDTYVEIDPGPIPDVLDTVEAALSSKNMEQGLRTLAPRALDSWDAFGDGSAF